MSSIFPGGNHRSPEIISGYGSRSALHIACWEGSLPAVQDGTYIGRLWDMGLMLKTLDALMFGGCEMGTISKSSSPKHQTDIKPSIISNLVRITSNSPFPIPAAHHPCETPGCGERVQGCDPAVAGDPRDLLLKTSGF